MKTKNGIVLLSTLFLLSFGCTNDMNEAKPSRLGYDDDIASFVPLKGTSWKLAGIVDVQTNELKELKPKDCERCYTFAFDTDTTAWGRTQGNDIFINLSQMPPYYASTKAGERGDGDGYLYSKVVRLMYSYVREGDELKFLYKEDDKSYYLLYKLVNQ
jgi:hypothetical protein